MRTVLEKAQKYLKSKSNSQRKNKTFYIYWSSGLFSILVLQNVISGQSQLWLIFQTKSRETDNHIQYTAASALFVLINRTKTSNMQKRRLQVPSRPHSVVSFSVVKTWSHTLFAAAHIAVSIYMLFAAEKLCEISAVLLDCIKKSCMKWNFAYFGHCLAVSSM